MHARAARTDRSEERIGLVRDQQESGRRRRLLERLQQRVLCTLVERIGGNQHGDLAPPPRRHQSEASREGAHLVDADLARGDALEVCAREETARDRLPLRHHPRDVGMDTARDGGARRARAARTLLRFGLAIRGLGKQPRQELLADAGWAGEEIGVMRLAAFERTAQEPHRARLAGDLVPRHTHAAVLGATESRNSNLPVRGRVLGCARCEGPLSVSVPRCC